MAIAKKIIALLERRGYEVNDTVRDALEEFLAEIEVGRPMGGFDDEAPDEDDGEDDDDAGGGAEELAPIHHIACPHCGERIGIALDLSGEDQDTIQDCEVCCSPIRVVYTVVNGRMGTFSAEAS